MNPSVFDEQKTTVASLADKESCPVLHLPRNGASRIKQTDLSVRLKGRHRRGSAPMFISCCPNFGSKFARFSAQPDKEACSTNTSCNCISDFPKTNEERRNQTSLCNVSLKFVRDVKHKIFQCILKCDEKVKRDLFKTP